MTKIIVIRKQSGPEATIFRQAKTSLKTIDSASFPKEKMHGWQFYLTLYKWVRAFGHLSQSAQKVEVLPGTFKGCSNSCSNTCSNSCGNSCSNTCCKSFRFTFPYMYMLVCVVLDILQSKFTCQTYMKHIPQTSSWIQIQKREIQQSQCSSNIFFLFV